ncbi:aminopeptidase RNPEPL1 isoform X2 [Moschus berezovskii]|uniref:aminopeptidase RNPEPL1 isoform X2 n=1 Tax=Moschus berezovskii TaxID=68408 RepID=UPI002444EB3E|nr:aminopeptidase RNPEPL1 isoform X2 [Moschus berezovskii]
MLHMVSHQRVPEEPPARPARRAFPFLQPSAWATCTRRLPRPHASHLVLGRGPRTAPGLTAPSRALGPWVPRSLAEPRAPRPPAHDDPGPAAPAARPPRAQRPRRRRPSGAGAGRRTARGRAGRLPARLPVVPAPRRPAPGAPRPLPAAPGGRRPWISPSAAAMAAQCCCRKAPGAEAAPARPPPEPPPALDVASASSAQLFRLRHLQLGLELRPEARELAGCLVLELCARRPAPRALVLDAHPALRLHSAAFRRAPAAAATAAAAAEPPCAFAFAAPGPGPAPPPPLPAFCEAPGAEPACCPLAFRVDPFTDYGSSLTVTLPPELQAHQPFQVILRYTSTDAPAIWWLDPELTYGSAKPFVFTQGHSVCNRSFFPCFDTPAVKCTYSAVVKAPSGVQVLMSATQSSYVEEEGVYRFHMEHPVPAYLVALVAGDLQPADIGPRSRVWAEPCLLPTATSKLSGAVEQWLSAAERLYGPYLWGRYDIVFLPPSFPIVAMENPCLTFITSSILESDEFLVIDVIHEVAHSWFGNAVTNATWEEMWLSEGLATYAQRRITTETHGAAFTCLETAFRLDALHRQMKLLGEDSPVSKLQVKLEPGVNPSHLMNLFTYEKGYCFVYYLSQLCGDPQRFDDFLRAYVEKYKFTSVVAQDLLDSFLTFFPELKEQSVDCRAGLEFERWLNATGPPLAEPDLSQGSSLTRPVEALFQLWTAEPLDQAAASASAIDISKWRTFQTALFLDRLLDGSPLPQEVVMSLSKCYSSLLDSMNAEIRIRWLQIVVRNDYYPDLHRVRRFLESQMSRMYTIPLYEDLCTGALKSFALEVFCQTQGRLHPNLRRTIQQILSQGLGPGAEPGGAAADSEPGLLLGDEAPGGTISLRDVNVSA